jgi:hypothetical protein
MEPREFVDKELQIIGIMFKTQKEIYPMVVLIKDNERFQIPFSYKNAAHKEIVSQGIKDLVKKSEPDVVVFMAEAWSKIIKDKLDRIPLGISPNDPDKHEILIVQIEFQSGEKFSAEAQIIREGQETHLAPFMYADSSMSMGGFMDFFPIKRVN